MSDRPQGQDWWQASDDKWYPPPHPPVSAATEERSAPSHPQREDDHHPLFISLGVFAILVLLVLIVAVSVSGDGDGDEAVAAGGTPADSSETPEESVVDETESTDVEPPETTGPADGEDDGDDGGELTSGECTESTGELGDDLVLVECGWSTVRPPLGDFTGSYGFAVENTGSEARLDIGFTVTLFDEEGGVLISEDETIWLLQPGEKLGIGRTILEPSSFDSQVGGVEIQYGGQGCDFCDPPPSGSLTASSILLTPRATTGATITFEVVSTYPERVESSEPYVIFRNSSGAIVGGDAGFRLSDVAPDSTIGGDIVTTTQMPDHSDDSRADVYVDPGPDSILAF